MKIKKLPNFKSYTQSISFKIWYVMALTLGLLFIFILLINMTILRKAKNDFVFEQLQKAAAAKEYMDHSQQHPKSIDRFADFDEDDSLRVAHFKLDKLNGQYTLTVDQFAQALYIYKNQDANVLKRIAERLTANDNASSKGILKDREEWHYYYAEWDSSKTSAMVFLTSASKPEFPAEVFILIIILLVISFFASRIAAKKLSKPIEELEVFAEEVSKRNWSAPVPKTEPDEIGHLGIVLENMRDALKIAEERDREFLQSTSHDLKTPVMIIKGYAQAILDGMNIDLENSAAEIILSESTRLERKITQLLRLNTLGHSLSYLENREVIRLDKILKNLTDKFSIIRPELNLELHLSPLEVLGDSEALLVAFENILENQLRYAKSIIRMTLSNTQNNMMEMTIFNDGPRFEFDNPEELFDAYKKDKDGKFGLGLAIVKQVITAHGGTITASNTTDGIVFRILLPEFYSDDTFRNADELYSDDF